MKKILITCILSLLFVGKVSSQANLPYKPLKSFNTDTVSYLLYNFMDRVNYYKGKTVKKFMNDLETPVIHFNFSQNFKTGEYYGIYIYIYTEKKISDLWDNHRSSNAIKLEFHKNVPELIVDMLQKNILNIALLLQNIGDYRIEKIEVLLDRDHPDYKKYYPDIPETKSSSPQIIIYPDDEPVDWDEEFRKLDERIQREEKEEKERLLNMKADSIKSK